MASCIRNCGMYFASYQEKVKLTSQLLAVAGGGRKKLLHCQASAATPLHPIFLIPLSLSPEQEVGSV